MSIYSFLLSVGERKVDGQFPLKYFSMFLFVLMRVKPQFLRCVCKQWTLCRTSGCRSFNSLVCAFSQAFEGMDLHL